MDHSQGTSSLACSFCGKSRPEVLKLISGPTVFICSQCVSLCCDLIEEGARKDVSEVIALERMSLLEFLKLHFPDRAVDSIPLGELRSTIRAEWERRLPEPPTTRHSRSPQRDLELEKLSTRYGVPAIDLIDAQTFSDFDPEALKLIERDVALWHRALPWRIAERPIRTLIVAMADPSDAAAIAELRLATGLPIATVVAVEKLLLARIERCYPRPMTAERAAVLDDARKRIGRGERVHDVVAGLHDISERELNGFLLKEYGVPAIDLDSFDIDPEIVTLIPEEAQRKHALVPVNRVGGSLIIAMADPSNIHAIDDVKFLTSCNVEVVVASEAEIRRKIDQHFPRTH